MIHFLSLISINTSQIHFTFSTKQKKVKKKTSKYLLLIELEKKFSSLNFSTIIIGVLNKMLPSRNRNFISFLQICINIIYVKKLTTILSNHYDLRQYTFNNIPSSKIRPI